VLYISHFSSPQIPRVAGAISSIHCPAALFLIASVALLLRITVSVSSPPDQVLFSKPDDAMTLHQVPGCTYGLEPPGWASTAIAPRFGKDRPEHHGCEQPKMPERASLGTASHLATKFIVSSLQIVVRLYYCHVQPSPVWLQRAKPNASLHNATTHQRGKVDVTSPCENFPRHALCAISFPPLVRFWLEILATGSEH
jgi:hypothetical protein